MCFILNCDRDRNKWKTPCVKKWVGLFLPPRFQEAKSKKEENESLHLKIMYFTLKQPSNQCQPDTVFSLRLLLQPGLTQSHENRRKCDLFLLCMDIKCLYFLSFFVTVSRTLKLMYFNWKYVSCQHHVFGDVLFPITQATQKDEL